ncbi:MAG: hypothetical protein ABI947_28175 [Chloroflexota bacterium]
MSGSNRPVTVWRLLLTLLCLAIVLVVCDPIVGLLARRFYPEPPYILLDLPSFYGLDRFWQMTDAGQKPIVFTGSSMVFHGVSPHVFDSSIATLTGKSVVSVDVGVTGQTSDIARDLVQNIFIPKGASAIFYTTEMRAYAARITLASYQRSPLGYIMQFEPGLRKTLGLWLLQHSALARYHNNIHDLLTGARPIEYGVGYYNVLDDRGHASAWDVQDATLSMPIPNDFTPLKIEAPYQAALTEIATACQQSNTPCIVVNMPLHRTLYQVIPTTELAQFRTMILESLGKGKAAFWDFNTDSCIAWLGDKSFLDRDHLNEPGAKKFTYLLAVLYAHQFMGQPIPAESPVDCAYRSS